MKVRASDINKQNIRNAIKVLTHIPSSSLGGDQKKKLYIGGLKRAERFLTNAPAAAVAGSAIAGLSAKKYLEKRAYGIPVRGARGPRKFGIAQVNKSVPLPKGEPAGRPIIGKKALRSYLGKKNKVLPGNITDIGKLT